MVRVLRTAGLTLRQTFYLDGEPIDADGSVTVAVKRLDGTVVESGPADGPDDHVYSYDFAGSDQLDILRVVWSATIGGDAITLDQDVIEVVGGFYFTLSQGRAADKALANTTKFTDDFLLSMRDAVETECERITRQAWVPRFARVTLNGSDSCSLRVPHRNLRAVRAVSIAQYYGATPSVLSPSQVAQIAPGDGYLSMAYNTWPCGTKNIVVEYEYGADAPPPDLVNAAKIRFKSQALTLSGQVGITDRARQITNQETGTVILATADPDHTGLPSVDAVYLDYQMGSFG